jgi:hypothetical protein
MNPLIQSKNATILPVLIVLMLGCFGLSPQAGAECGEGCDTLTFSTFIGENALLNNSGFSNAAGGFWALLNNTTGVANTAVGEQALLHNTTGNDNTAYGVDSLYDNTTGTQNTATGWEALTNNTTGNLNTAAGLGSRRGETALLF